MNESSCVFCKIIHHEIPVPFVASNDDVIVIKDRAPKAPIHLLIIPKKHICNLTDITPGDTTLLSSMLYMAQQLSQIIPGAQAFRLISNNGADVGQSVFHIHVHFLAGKHMSDF